ncbi:MAG: mannose-1-phosphate guanylyltransferase [Bacteroidaceae bacterium]|nr:mannose-1-phosphate guanylyltransferase [Bacteroidaceae bacterium]
MKDLNYCLILAGGNGSRLWPVSRTAKPKQFLDMLGTGRTLLQQTYDRMAAFIDPRNIYVSTNVDYLPLVYEQLPQVDDEHILEEPVRRGTLASVAWGTVVIGRAEPDAKVFVVPSDQLITSEMNFQQDVLHCFDFVAKHDGMVVMGITPNRPETGYGYIQLQTRGAKGDDDIYLVKSFTEKPSQEFADMFLQEGDFLWNAGMFCYDVRMMLDKLCQLVPEYQMEIPRMMKEAENADPKLVPETFSRLPNLNVDVSILERSNNVYVHRCNFGWADLGTWSSIYDDSPKDERANAVINAKAFLYDCQNTLVRLPKGQTLVAKGLDGYVVVAEGDILMICPREDVVAMRKMHTDTKFG